MQTAMSGGSFLVRIGQTLVACVFGLVGLPSLARSVDPGATNSWLWLALAGLVSVSLFVPASGFVAVLDRLLARAHVPGGYPLLARPARIEIARLILAGAYLVVIQAMLRRPVVATFGSAAEPFVIEATWGALALVALVVLMGWMHHAARPLVEGAARSTLDVLLATTGSDAATERAEAKSVETSAARASAATMVRIPESAPSTLAAPTQIKLTATRPSVRRIQRD
jgi:hypothetical protein